MVPTHHLHISFGVIFLVVITILAIIAICAMVGSSKRKAKLEEKRLDLEYLRRKEVYFPPVSPTNNHRDYINPVTQYTIPQTNQYSGATNVVHTNDGPGLGTGLVTGLVLGELLANEHDHNGYSNHSYPDTSPSSVDSGTWDSGVSYDSGSSSSSTDSSGIDVSW